LNIRRRLSVTELEGEESQGNRTHIAEMSPPIAEQLMNEVCDGKKVSVTAYVFWRTRQMRCRWLDVNARRTVRIPDIDEMSRPKRPPPIHEKDPKRYWKLL